MLDDNSMYHINDELPPGFSNFIMTLVTNLKTDYARNVLIITLHYTKISILECIPLKLLSTKSQLSTYVIWQEVNLNSPISIKVQ